MFGKKVWFYIRALNKSLATQGTLKRFLARMDALVIFKVVPLPKLFPTILDGALENFAYWSNHCINFLLDYMSFCRNGYLHRQNRFWPGILSRKPEGNSLRGPDTNIPYFFHHRFRPCFTPGISYPEKSVRTSFKNIPLLFPAYLLPCTFRKPGL